MESPELSYFPRLILPPKHECFATKDSLRKKSRSAGGPPTSLLPGSFPRWRGFAHRCTVPAAWMADLPTLVGVCILPGRPFSKTSVQWALLTRPCCGFCFLEVDTCKICRGRPPTGEFSFVLSFLIINSANLELPLTSEDPGCRWPGVVPAGFASPGGFCERSPACTESAGKTSPWLNPRPGMGRTNFPIISGG